MRLIRLLDLLGWMLVSIHAPREGCDVCKSTRPSAQDVSIHAPREGCDRDRFNHAGIAPKFQFTHPGRGATTKATEKPNHHRRFNSRTPGGVRRSRIERLSACDSFNSRTPGGVRRYKECSICTLINVSIHAPREGCDAGANQAVNAFLQFQFTHPGRGATNG